MGDLMARYRQRSKGASKYARASYSEIYDMHTEVGKTTLIGIHTPVTNRWQRYLNGFCNQFARFRYKGASVSFVPVTTLPADPLQVSYEAGEPTIDPRDLMNPIIHCGMRGQSMGNYLDEIFRFNISHRLDSIDDSTITDSDLNRLLTDLEQAYYTALSSPQFRKSHVQQGFRKSGLHPMVYQVSTNRPYNYVSSVDPDNLGDGESISTMGPYLNTEASDELHSADSGSVRYSGLYVQRDFATYSEGLPAESPYLFDVGQFFTNKLTSLGWMDTLQRRTEPGVDSSGLPNSSSSLTTLPKVYMYFVMLPPAYKTEMYFRVIVRHYFEFSGFRTLGGPFSPVSGFNNAYDGPIENLPVDSLEVATLDVYNGDAALVSDGAM